jgi:cbb3-type cytochrome oxidase subunit 3
MGFLFLLFLGALGYLYSQYQEGKKQIYSEKKS